MFIINSVTKEQIGTIEQKLAVAGTKVCVNDPAKPNNYSIYNPDHHITADAVFDPVVGTLTVNITKKPFLIPESAIKSGIEEAIRG